MSILAILRNTPLSGRLALSAGLLGHGVVVLSCLPFLTYTRGTSFRPMVWDIVLFEIAILTFILGAPAAIISFKSCRRWISITSLLLSVTPLPFGIVLLRTLVALRGLHLSG